MDSFGFITHLYSVLGKHIQEITLRLHKKILLGLFPLESGAYASLLSKPG
jgi:hypothetical protein